MSIELSIVIYAVIANAMDALAWGLCGYIFSRIIGIRKSLWYCDYVVIITIYLLWEFWSTSLLKKLQISIGNQKVLAFIGGNAEELFEIGYFDIVVALVVITLGYILGMLILRRCKKM